jgi:uncharacterized protein (DUF736 family)
VRNSAICHFLKATASISAVSPTCRKKMKQDIVIVPNSKMGFDKAPKNRIYHEKFSQKKF